MATTDKANTMDDPPAIPSSQLPKKDGVERGTLETYYIINVKTGDCAALRSDTDRLDIVNTNDHVKRGSEWFITHIKRDEYSIQNHGFRSFASYDNRPQVGDGVLGKRREVDLSETLPSVWRIRPTPGPNVSYTISPLENSEIFWMSSSNTEGTPVHADTNPSPIIPSVEANSHLFLTQMLLEKLPDVDPDPVKLTFEITKIILGIAQLPIVKDNLDAVERRIVATSTQFSILHNALDELKAKRPGNEQGTDQLLKTLQEELNDLYRLRGEYMNTERDHHDEKRRISAIFERINEAGLQYKLAIGIRVLQSSYEIEERLKKSFLNDLQPSKIADHKYFLEGREGKLLGRAACTPGTRVRLLDNIITWAKDTLADSQDVYWLFGPAGSGKSTIAHTIARRFDFAGDAAGTVSLGGNFFCSRQFEETKQSKQIIRTLTYHLALTCKPFADALGCSGPFDCINHDIPAQIHGLLVKPWEASEAARLADPSSPPHYLVIIDALDEIDGEGGSTFLNDLFDVINAGHLRGLKFFATSRPDPDLVTIVAKFGRSYLYRLQDVQKEEVKGDIHTFLTVKLPHFAHRDEMDKLVTSADGLFIYAATIVRYLARYGPSEQEDLLKQLVSISEPVTLKRSEGDSPLLDELYTRILVDAFHDLDDGIRRRRLEILHTFLCTTQQTSTTVVADLLSVPNSSASHLEGANAVLKALHAVLYTEEDGRVLSYHKSFSDFLFNQKRAQGFWCNPVVLHRRLMESCFGVMSVKLKFNIGNLPSSFILDRASPILSSTAQMSIPRVLRYSCQNWIHHLRSLVSIDHDPLCKVLADFLRLQALFWIETMNLMGMASRCHTMLQTAGDWVKKFDSALATNFTEAASFALYFSGSPASLSTPHLYISALVTWPRDLEPCRGWRAFFPGTPKLTVNPRERSGMALMTLKSDSEFYSAELSGDGSRIVSGSEDKSVRVWSASTGEVIKVLDGHAQSVLSVSFSGDGNQIASGSADGSVRVWDTSTGKVLQVLKHAECVWSVAFSNDGTQIVSGSDKSVRVWEASSGKLVKVLNGHTKDVRSVAFSSNGNQIVSGSDDNSARVWNALTSEGLKVLNGHTKSVRSVAFSGSGDWIVSGSDDESVRVWNASTGKVHKVLVGHSGLVESVAFSRDGSRIASGASDNTLRMWDASTGKVLKVMNGHTRPIRSVAFSNDGTQIVSGSFDQSLRLWDTSIQAGGGSQVATDSHTKSGWMWSMWSDKAPKLLDGHSDWISSLAFSSNGSRIASGSADNSMRVWDISTGRVLKVLGPLADTVQSMAFSNDGSRIVSSSSRSSKARVWDALTGKMLRVLKHTESVQSVAFSKDGSQIVSGSGESMRVWDTSTSKMLKVLVGHSGLVESVAFSGDGRRIISGSSDMSVRVWDALAGGVPKVLCGHSDRVRSVAFSSDGRQIVSGSDDTSVRVWDVLAGEILEVLNGHTHWIQLVAFTDDGCRVVSGSWDNSVRVWDWLAREVLMVLLSPTDSISCFAFSTDGNRVVSGSSKECSVRVWDASIMPPYVREHVVDSYGSWTPTGWLLSPTGEDYLMFVPPSVRLAEPRNILTMPPTAHSCVDFTLAKMGTQWHECFNPRHAFGQL